jgi:hypothetical protein
MKVAAVVTKKYRVAAPSALININGGGVAAVLVNLEGWEYWRRDYKAAGEVFGGRLGEVFGGRLVETKINISDSALVLGASSGRCEGTLPFANALHLLDWWRGDDRIIRPESCRAETSDNRGLYYLLEDVEIPERYVHPEPRKVSLRIYLAEHGELSETLFQIQVHTGSKYVRSEPFNLYSKNGLLDPELILQGPLAP